MQRILLFKSEIFVLILELIKKNDILISSHGYDELADDDILAGDVLSSKGDFNGNKKTYKIDP